MRRFVFTVCLLSLPGLVLAQARSLEAHLARAAEHFSLRLVYSPTSVPDTSFVYAPARGLSPKQVLDTLTAPHGLRYTLLGQQVILTRDELRRFSVNGFVEDASTGERLVGATVAIAERQRGTTTNGYGYFALPDVREGERLRVSYVGYPAAERVIRRATSASLVVRLQPTYELSVVEVRAAIPLATALPNEGVALPPSVLDDAEFSFGESNVNTWLTQLPGVQSAPAGYGGYSMRGADPNQNLVLVDDATLYLPSHAGGLTGAVSGDAIQSLTLHKNAGRARYGDRVGGVLDVRLKDGNRDERSTSLSVGITDVQLTTEGPLGKGSYFVTGRRGLTDFWLDFARPSVQPAESSVPDLDFVYYDFTGKANLPLGKRQRLYASVYVGRDTYRDRDEVFSSEGGAVDAFLDQSNRDWSNTLATLRHSVAVGSRWFFATTATLSSFSYDATDFFLLREEINSSLPRATFSQSQFATNVRDFGLKHDAQFAFRPGVSFTLGVDATMHRFLVGTRTAVGDEGGVPDLPSPGSPFVSEGDLPQLNTADVAAYASAEVAIGERTVAEVGLRATSQLGEGERFSAVLPRLMVDYTLDPSHTLHLEAGAARQFLHSVSTLNPGLPRDIWVPSVAGLRPQRSRYASVGLTRSARADAPGYALTAYAQALDGLARFSRNFASLAPDQWTSQLRQGRGLSYGLEAEATWPLGRVELSGAYTYAVARRDYGDAFGELSRRERFRLDRRHRARVAARLRIGQRWAVGATFNYGSGLPARLPEPNAASPNLPSTNVPLTNSWSYTDAQIQLRPFHSLDIGARRTVVSGDLAHRLTFGVQNVYLRKNALFVSLQRTSDALPGASNYRFSEVSMLPILPFVRYTITF